MRKTIISVFVALSSLSAYAQKDNVTSVVDLGQVTYFQPATATFEFKNTSSETLSIDRVDTGCGCAKATFSTHKVAPGKNFEVKVTYNARTMGHFDRIIDVYTKGSTTPIMLELRGQVIEGDVDNSRMNLASTTNTKKKDKKKENQTLPEKLGELQADCNFVEFEDVPIGEVSQQRFHIYNPTNETVEPQLLHLPAYIKAQITPSKLAPKKTAEVLLTFDSRIDISEEDIGLMQDVVFLGKNPGDKVSKDKKMTISAVITPSRSSASKQVDTNAPYIFLSDRVITARISKGKKKTQNVTVENKGKTALEIKRIQVFAQGLEVTLDKNVVEPGEKIKMKVVVNSKEIRTSQGSPRILLVTNDPEHQTVFIDIKDEN